MAGQAEKSGLSKVLWFGVIQLIALASGWVASFVFLWGSFANLTPSTLPQNPTPSQLAPALVPLFRNLSLLIPVMAAVQVASLTVLLFGFRQLKAVDARFSLPTTMTIVMVVGAIVVVAGAVPLLNALPNIIAQAPSTSGSSLPSGFTAAIATVIGYFLLILLGGLLNFIGLVGGQMLGLWRVGSRYDETLLKLGAIFAIIPLLNIVAPVLVIVGADQAKRGISPPA